MKALHLFTIALVLSTMTACGEPRVSLSQGAREYTASDYQRVLKLWTRSESLVTLSALDDLLTATATFESWDFRWAYVVRYAEDYRLTIDQRKALLDKTLDETRDTHNFYVALYGTKIRWTDISRPNSAWIVRLIDDQGNETAPSSIDFIPKPGALEKTYFPYSSVWRHAFRVKFPHFTADGRPTISRNAKWFGIRFAGAEGNEELRWVLDNDAARNAAFGENVVTTF